MFGPGGALLGGGKALRVWEVDVMEEDALPAVAIMLELSRCFVVSRSLFLFA